MKTTTYLLPEHWAPYLINDDPSGLSDEEYAEINQWIDTNKPGFCIGCSYLADFCVTNDSGGLADMCLTYTFEKVT